MSTKSSVYYDDANDIHVYEECFEDGVLYVDEGRSTVQLSIAAASAIGTWARQTLEDWRRTASLTDEQIATRVEKAVDERIKYAHEAKGKPKGSAAHFLALAGLFGYGDPDDPRDEQIARGTEWWKREREVAKKRIVDATA